MERPTETTSEATVAIPAGTAPSRPLLISHTSIADEGRFIAGTLLAGRYRIVGLLGKGGMGEVYRATDLALGQSVALKFLPPAAADNPQLLERFHGEVRVARQVSHPNVCRVFDIGEADGMPFISMEYVDGEDLSSLLLRIGRLPADKAIDTARRICAGLAAAHAKGVIHRDLKPHNIMMNRRGEIVIMDFGLAAIASQLSGPEARNGTPAYMSPEQLKGTEVTSRSDIYALGLVLYELFTGKRPYEGKTARQMIALQEAAQYSSMSLAAADIEPAIDHVVRRCLDPDPSKRPDSPLAVSAALPGGDPLAAALAAGETPSPELVAASGRTEGMAPRYAWLCLLTILACICVAPWLKGQKYAFLRGPEGYPPEVLRQKARETAAALGYSEKPADSYLRLSNRFALLTYLDLRPAPRHWKEWLAAEGPAMAFYRESPVPMVARPSGQIEEQNPPLTEPGMISINLDTAGRLREFSAVPKGDQPGIANGVEAVFRAAQLDFQRFTEVTPTTIPVTATDRLRAWKGPHPGLPGLDVTVEIGEWKNRVSHVKFLWPWTQARTIARNPIMAQIRQVLDPALACVGIFFAILLARRNWKQGRGDRRGALAVALAELLFKMVVWTGLVHPVATGAMSFLFFNGLSDAVFEAAMLLLFYLAMEPWLRARWPHSVITWNRILAGKWKDAQVNAHVLMGAAAGVAMWTGDEIRLVLSIEKNGLDTGAILFALHGTPQWIAMIFARGEEALRTGLVIFYVIFGLRMILRRDWIAAIAAAVVFSFLEGNLSNALDLQAELAGYVVLFTLLMFVLLKLGLVATIAAIFFANTLAAVTLGSDLTVWSAPTGLATIALMLGIVLFAFRRSLGEHGLLGPPGPPLHS